MRHRGFGYSTRILLVVASLGVTASAKTAATCTAAGVQAAAPAGMTITPITDGNTPGGITEQDLINGGGVVLVPPNAKLGTPEFCFVQGTVMTNSLPVETANFQAGLPTVWNGKFLFKGCMVLCGIVDVPELEAMQHGYASFATDDGHIGDINLGGTFDGSWALYADGTPNTEALTDYYYRAVHTVTQLGKLLTQGFYSQAVGLSYFAGCSDGGREAMVEVSRFPADYDGVIAGDPFFNMAGQTVDAYNISKVQLRDAGAAVVPASLLHILDKAIMDQCDTADGVADGLIQDPALCNYNPQTKLPICSAKHPTDCFTQDQADSIASWFTAITDASGGIAYQGYPVANTDDVVGKNLRGWGISGNDGPPLDITSAQPWGDESNAPGSWLFADNVLRYLVFQNATYDSNSEPGMTFNVLKAKVENLMPDTTIQAIKLATQAGSGDVAKQALKFLSAGKKLIMYHGFSDDLISPYHTLMYYKALAKLKGGYPTLQANARLFMVPGMYHCGGGPGPNVFDMLTALENWVEEPNMAPDAILATGGVQLDEMGNPRSMPLCQFPEMASYNGTGAVNNGASWSCVATDQRLLKVGPNGHRAGVH